MKEKLDKCVKEKLLDFCDVLNIPINKAVIKKVSGTKQCFPFKLSLILAVHFTGLYVTGRSLCKVIGVFGVSTCYYGYFAC